VEEWIEVPLVTDGTCVGKIIVDNYSVRPVPPGTSARSTEIRIEPNEQDLVKCAAFAANVLAEDRKAGRVRKESNRLRELRKLSERVAGATKTEEALQAIVESASSVLGATGVHIRIPEGEGLVLGAGVGPYYELAKRTRHVVPLSDTLSGSVKAWTTREMQIVQDATDDRSIEDTIASQRDEPKAQALRGKIRSFACFPIVFEGEIIGVLDIQSDRIGYFGRLICEAAEDFVSMIGPLIRIEQYWDRLIQAARITAHRLKSPIFAIQGHVGLWDERGNRKEDIEHFANETIQAISHDAARVAHIVDDLKRFLTTPESVSDFKDVDINAVVKEAAEGIVKAHGGISLASELSSNLPLVHSSGQFIQEMVQELVANACEEMHGSGRVSLRTRPATDADRTDYGLGGGNQFVLVAIADTGPGIRDNAVDQIFEPFFTTKQNGSGLGLAFVRNAALALGGHIRAVNIEPTGAEFTLVIPVRRQEKGDSGR
jgi:signal transduction histidine kinase